MGSLTSARTSSAGPQVVTDLLAGMMSMRLWHDDSSEGDTVPEHCTSSFSFETVTSRLLSPPAEDDWSRDTALR